MFIKADEVVHEFFRRDADGNVIALTRALDGVKMQVEEGEFIAILGHNGSGKSTFAKHLNSILVPTEGTIFLDGMDTKDKTKEMDIRQRAGMVFQNPDNQMVASIIEEDVAFGPENLGVPSEEIWQRVEYALNVVGMTAYAKHASNRLSGGQKQRIAIAGIMAMQPKCIILDESTAMLDPAGRKEVLHTLKQLNKREKITVILITHYMEEALLADRIFVMAKGKVAMTGTPKSIFARAKELKKLHLEVPQIALLAMELRKQGIAVPDEIITVEDMVKYLEDMKKQYAATM